MNGSLTYSSKNNSHQTVVNFAPFHFFQCLVTQETHQAITIEQRKLYQTAAAIRFIATNRLDFFGGGGVCSEMIRVFLGDFLPTNLKKKIAVLVMANVNLKLI